MHRHHHPLHHHRPHHHHHHHPHAQLVPTMSTCTRRGCNASLPTPASCIHHPGAPIFHEGLKSWSCCNTTHKPVLEFDQFLAIPGCNVLPTHSTEVQALPLVKNGKLVDPSSPTDSAAHKQEANVDMLPTQPLNADTLKAAQNSSVPKPWQEEKDSLTAVEKGSKCTRNACGFVHEGGERRREQEVCWFHKGSPVFHEGSKGWSCCKRRVLDFNDFLAIQPCTRAESGHLFPSTNTHHEGEEERVDCRIDHYETPTDVRLTVYAKGVEGDKSRITFEEQAVHFSLSLPPAPGTSLSRPRKFLRTLHTFAPIDASASTYTLSKFKVDLVLVKRAKGQSWPALESGDAVVGYGLTFGRDKDK
ncbi:hypothetical protein ACQY0O_001781 [Thecaphora frezii]